MDPSPLNLAVDGDVSAVDDIEPTDLVYEDLDVDGHAAPPPIAEQLAAQHEYSPADDYHSVDLTDTAGVVNLNRDATVDAVSTERPS
ncbi:MAG: hypothetical protein QOF57_1048 [Frankiaceae bacterium]|jgi:hypothetical protein|nr:hypothetical protein [Frankiaceae bacterium]